MGKVKIKVVNRSKHELPAFATEMSAGVDLRANIDGDIELKPLQRKLIPTGIYMALPSGYEVQIRPRSGLALKHGVTLLNTPGTIDADYRGEIGIIMVNLSDTDFVIHDGDRIAQMVVSRYEAFEWDLVDNLDVTSRGEGGFGHSGLK